MFRFENVLVAVGGRAPAPIMDGRLQQKLTPVHAAAIDFAHVTGAQLTFCAAMPPSQLETVSNESVAQLDDAIRQELISLQEYATTKGIRARCLMRTGDFSEELIHETFDDSYDLLIIGEASMERGNQQTGTRAIHKLLTQAKCSVWAMGALQQAEIQNVGFVSVISDNFALPQAVTFARLLNARLHVMHPINGRHLATAVPPSFTAPTPEQDQARLRELAESELKSQLERTDFRALPFGSKLEFLEEDSDVSISRYAAEHQLDLLIVDRQRLVRNQDSGQSLPTEWRCLLNDRSILAVVPSSESSQTQQT